MVKKDKIREGKIGNISGGKKLELFHCNKTVEQVNQMSPLTWAYIGDAVYELWIRTHLVDMTNLKPNKLHIESVQFVKAKAQADILEQIENDLTEQEKEIVRRGRNTQTHHIAKNATMKDYMYATAFEALIGYLYLTKQEQRLQEIGNKILENTY